MGSSKSGSAEASKAQQQAIGLQKSQWEEIMKNLSPYMSAGQPALQQLQGLSSLQGQQKALSDYYQSGQYQNLSEQARYQQLAAAEATGGLGASATSNALASIAPTLGQQWLSNQMQNYGNLASMGMNAAAGLGNAGQNYANNTGMLLQGLGSINAGKPHTLGSMAQGAASGALIGSSVPVIGTVAGAIGGGILGGLGTV